MMHFRIRSANTEDAPELSNLSAELGYLVSIKDLLERLPFILKSGDHALFVAESENGTMLGWIHACLSLRVESRPFAEVGGLVVNPDHRGDGIGRQLVDAASKWAVGKGMETLRIRSRATREDAHRFFAHLGFCMMKEQLVFERGLVGPHKGCQVA